MSTTKTWPSGTSSTSATSYSIPETGDLNWGNLSNFLTALADNAQCTTSQRIGFRRIGTTPETLNDDDCIILSYASLFGNSSITFPPLTDKKILFIVDNGRQAGGGDDIHLFSPDGASIDNSSLATDGVYVGFVASAATHTWYTFVKGTIL